HYEYDKPILDALYGENENRNRAVLRSFYGPLKESDRYIRFCFLTGITRIDHVTIFSGLNQLDDISTSDAYSAICGITEKELLSVFSEEMRTLADIKHVTLEEVKLRLKTMYDGYCFSKYGEKYSILSLSCWPSVNGIMDSIGSEQPLLPF
ncbi:MAG: AAA family ATPase, partial [Bullifex sp.]